MSERIPGDSRVPLRTAFVADKAVLTRHGASLCSSGPTRGIFINGWAFTTSHGPIADEPRLVALNDLISSVSHTEALLHLPEMIFDQDLLQIVNETLDCRILFSAADALVSWAARHNSSSFAQTIQTPLGYGYHLPPPDVIEVAHANQFQTNIQSGVQR